MTLKRMVAEAIGWYGTVAIVTAYVLVSFSMIEATSWVFQVLNLTGAIGIIVISTVKKVRQSIVLNCFWASIALVALIQLTTK